MSVLIPVGVSNRHMHLTREMMDALFGPGSELTVYRELYQVGEFASEQFVEMIGPKGTIPRVRVLGPLRMKLQIEVSRTDAYHLGINPPVGLFAPLPNNEAITLKGPHGSVTVRENVMISRRHIHLNSEEARQIGVKDGDTVFVAPASIRGSAEESRICIMGNVLIRVKDSFRLQMHIDTDEANAAGLVSGDHVYVVSASLGQREPARQKRLITESDVREAVEHGQKIRVVKGMIITPAARDLGRANNIFIE